jgi:hypothetical protein
LLQTEQAQRRWRAVLELTSTGSKLWRVAYRFNGKQRTVYVRGAYPSVSLADARAIRDSAKVLLAKGVETKDGVVTSRSSRDRGPLFGSKLTHNASRIANRQTIGRDVPGNHATRAHSGVLAD